MNWDRIRGHWKQLTGRAQERWGTLTHDHRAIAAGRRGWLAGKIQERCGLAREEAERQLAAWKRRVKDHLFNSDRR